MGCLPAAGYLGPTIYWLKAHDVLPNAQVCCIPTAIVVMLTGQPPISDPTLAASSGFFDIVHKRWDKALSRALGISAHILPPVAACRTNAGRLEAGLATRLGLPNQVVAGVALGDHQASLIGSGCDAPGDGLRIWPTFDGARHRPETWAEFLGVCRSNFTPSHITRAMVASIADELSTFYDAMRAEGFIGPSLIESSNALRRNGFLREAIARRLNLPLHMPEWDEEAAVGAVMIAARLSS